MPSAISRKPSRARRRARMRSEGARMDVLLIGHGAIAGYVAKALGAPDDPRIRWVLCRPGREAAARAAVPGAEPLDDLEALDDLPDVALELAGHAGLAQHGAAVLARGIDLGIVSTGALADDGLHDALEAAARSSGARLEALAGAVGGLDALAAAREGGLERVVYEARKPPLGWVGTPAGDEARLAGLTDPLVHFEGTARAAARAYPKNANVAASVALAGLGLDETSVRLVADPAAPGNTHRIDARGAFGRLRMELVGDPLPDNPKSSALTAMAALRFLRNRARPITI